MPNNYYILYKSYYYFMFLKNKIKNVFKLCKLNKLFYNVFKTNIYIYLE